MSSSPPTSPPAPPPAVRDALGRVLSSLPLRTGRLLLRPVTATDPAAVHAYRGLPEVARHLGHAPLTSAGARELVDRWLVDPAGATVVLERDGEVVGDVRLWLRPCAAKEPATTSEVEAGLGYALHPAHQGQGLATEGVRAVVNLLMDAGEVRRITARVFATARGSSALLRRLGFHLDGVDRAAVLAPEGDLWWDDECWSLVRGDSTDGR